MHHCDEGLVNMTSVCALLHVWWHHTSFCHLHSSPTNAWSLTDSSCSGSMFCSALPSTSVPHWQHSWICPCANIPLIFFVEFKPCDPAAPKQFLLSLSSLSAVSLLFLSFFTAIFALFLNCGALFFVTLDPVSFLVRACIWQREAHLKETEQRGLVSS